MPTVNPDAQPSANTDEVRAVFASFDFSRQPATTPLDQVLHELLAPCLGNEPGPDAAGCLALLPVQTGLGKTHSSLGLLIEQMLAQVQRRLEDPSAAARRLVYITDSIDNTRHAHDKLREFIGRNYDQDDDYRLAFQQWVNRLWEEKDAELTALHQQA